jgi:hypothetical protein
LYDDTIHRNEEIFVQSRKRKWNVFNQANFDFLFCPLARTLLIFPIIVSHEMFTRNIIAFVFLLLASESTARGDRKDLFLDKEPLLITKDNTFMKEL